MFSNQFMIAVATSSFLTMLVPAIAGNEETRQVINQVMTGRLEILAKDTIDALRTKQLKALEKIEDITNDRISDEIKNIQLQIDTLAKTAEETIKEKSFRIDELGKSIQIAMKEYNALVKEYNAAKANVESTEAETESKLSDIRSKIAALNSSIQSNINLLIEYLNEASPISEDLEALAKQLNSDIAELEGTQLDIENRLNNILEDIQSEIDARLAIYNAGIEETEAWIERQNSSLSGRAEEINDKIYDFNNANENLGRLIEDYNAIVRDYEEAANNANAIAEACGNRCDQGDVDNFNYWKNKAQGYEADLNRLRPTVESEQRYVQRLSNEIDSLRSSLEREENRVKRELANKQKAHDSELGEIQKYQRAEEKRFSEIQEELQQEINEIANVIEADQADYKVLENELQEIVDVIENNWGPDESYQRVLNAFETYSSALQRGENQVAAMRTLSGSIARLLQGNSDSPKLVQLYTDLQKVLNHSEEEQAVVARYNQKVKQLEALGKQLEALASKISSNETTYKQLIEEVKAYEASVNKEMDALRKQADKKVEELGELYGGTADAVNTLFGLQRQIYILEVQIYAYAIGISNSENSSELDLTKEELQQAMENGDNIIDGETFINDIQSLIKKYFPDFPADVDPLEIEEYYGQDVVKEAELKGEKKKFILYQWYKMLMDIGFFDTEHDALEDAFGSQNDLRKFFNDLFIMGFQDFSTLYLAEFEDGNKNYRMVINGVTYWMGLNGELIDVVKETLFQHNFATPEDTAVGAKLREVQDILDANFTDGFQDLSEKAREQLVLAQSLLQYVDTLQTQKSEEDRLAIIEAAKTIGQAVLGVAPLAGDGQDLYELFVGKDIYGKDLSVRERALAAAGLAMGSRVIWEGIIKGMTNVYAQVYRKAFC